MFLSHAAAAECGQDTDSCLLPIACNGTEVGNCDCQCSEGFAGDGCTGERRVLPTHPPRQLHFDRVSMAAAKFTKEWMYIIENMTARTEESQIIITLQ